MMFTYVEGVSKETKYTSISVVTAAAGTISQLPKDTNIVMQYKLSCAQLCVCVFVCQTSSEFTVWAFDWRITLVYYNLGLSVFVFVLFFKFFDICWEIAVIWECGDITKTKIFKCRSGVAEARFRKTATEKWRNRWSAPVKRYYIWWAFFPISQHFQTILSPLAASVTSANTVQILCRTGVQWEVTMTVVMRSVAFILTDPNWLTDVSWLKKKTTESQILTNQSATPTSHNYAVDICKFNSEQSDSPMKY